MKASRIIFSLVILVVLIAPLLLPLGCVHHKKGARESHKKIKALRKNNKHFTL